MFWEYIIAIAPPCQEIPREPAVRKILECLPLSLNKLWWLYFKSTQNEKEEFIMKTIEYSVRDNIGFIALNRPEKHNALSFDLLDDIDEAFDTAEADEEVNVVVLKGNGKSFCSGYDLQGSYYIHGSREGLEWDLKNSLMTLRGIEARYMRIWNFPKPTIAQIHGHCLAGGCYLQMICDISVAAEDAHLGHPLGSGGVSSMPLWQVLLGPKKARYLLFTNKIIDGIEAERIGLVSEVVPADKLEETVNQIAANMAESDPQSLFYGKESLNMHQEILGLGALFRYHGHLNALGRLRRRS
jgi:enoyl-CoA hydratase